jgi:hypothetical protein
VGIGSFGAGATGQVIYEEYFAVVYFVKEEFFAYRQGFAAVPSAL